MPKNNTSNNLVSALAAPVSTTFRTKLIMFSVTTLCLKGCHYILLVPVSAAPQRDRASSLLPTSYGVHEGSKSHVLNWRWWKMGFWWKLCFQETKNTGAIYQRTVCGQLATALTSIRGLISDKLFRSSLLQIFSRRWRQKSTFGGREDGSVGKMPTMKHENLSLDSQHPYKPSMVVPVSDPRIGTQRRGFLRLTNQLI